MATIRILANNMLWLLMIAALWCCNATPVTAAPYFSIHVASFSFLKNANAFVNSISAAEKVVFWREVDVPGKGRFYRVFIGRYPTYQSALTAWNILNKEEKVIYQGIFQFESKDIPGISETAVKDAPEADAATLPPPPASVDKQSADRFIDNGDGTVTDSKSRLMWVKNGWSLTFFAASQWEEATAKCRQFSQAGYSDWTLPSVVQWETLIDSSQEAPALPNPNPFENVIIHMPYWSSTEMVKYPVKAYAVLLYNGRIHQLGKDERAFIFPVRRLAASQ